MPNFEYSGRSDQGQQTKGQLEASNLDAAVAVLFDRGVTPIHVREVTTSDSLNRQLEELLGMNKIKQVELIMFCRQMYTITKSGIPLVRGLRGLAASIRHEGFQRILHDLAGKLESGSPLSSAMAKHPQVFNNLFVSMVSVGETTGNLDGVFKELVAYLERDDATRKSIKSATRYPMFVAMALALAITVVNILVIPKFADMFAQFDATLPLVTRILIGTSYAFVNYWWVLLVVVGGATAGAYFGLRTPQGGLWWGAKKLKFPIVGDIINRASMARYARSFSLMLRAGVPLNQALTLCARAIDNPFLAQKIDQIRRGVERGDGLLKTHVQAQMFSPLVIQMIAVGEESGQVEELLGEVADFYEREVDYDLKKLSDRIEPIMIVIMAVFVMILALGIFLPMWDMYNVQKG